MKTIMISLDTLCASHLGSYGYQFDTTPCIDKWARQGVRFERCYATDVPTPPSYTSIFTGRYGIHNGIFGFQPSETFIPGPPMLQEHFNRNGHETCAISNLFYPCPWFLPGWQTIKPPGVRFQGGVATDVTDTAIDWLSRRQEQDFFLFVHYWEPHQPYNKAPEEHRKLFPTGQYEGLCSDLSLVNSNPLLKGFYEDYHRRGEGDAYLSSEEVTARYDSQIHFVDAEVGRLFDWLESQAIADDITVVLTSDHGEAFGENGSFDHFTCYENITHVPLFIRSPELPQGKTVEGLVTGADIYATILETAGIPIEGEVDSRSLIPCAKGDCSTPHDFVVVDCNALCAQRMIVQDDWGLVHTIHRGPYDHFKSWQLFALSGDPEKDLADENPELVKELKQKLANWVIEMTDGGVDPLVVAAHDGGWTFGHGMFLTSVLENLEVAAANPHVWPTLKRVNGGRAMDLLRRVQKNSES